MVINFSKDKMSEKLPTYRISSSGLRKISDEKTKFFSEICEFLDENEVNYQISKENKLIFIKIGEKFFKLDLIESRTPLF